MEGFRVFLAGTITKPMGGFRIMLRRMVVYSCAVFALIAMAVSLWAKSPAHDSLSATITLTSATKVGTSTLQPGDYTVKVAGHQASFEQNGNVVAQVECSLKTLPEKAQYSEFATDHDRLTEVQFGGKNQAAEFTSTQASMSRKP